MRRYRAVVIDGRKVIGRCAAAVTAAVVAATIILSIKISDKGHLPQGENIAKDFVTQSIPYFAVAEQPEEHIGNGIRGALRKILFFALTFDPFDTRTVVFGGIPMVKTISEGYLASLANAEISSFFGDGEKEGGTLSDSQMEKEELPIKEVDSSQGKVLPGKKNKILIRNETEFGINTEEMLGSNLTFSVKGEGPKVLILHTHTTESYSPEGKQTYQADKSDRSTDERQNVVAVGEVIKEVFDKKGIETIHDKTIHDQPSFNGSYAASLKTVEKYKARYPSICIVLDVHRDAYIYENGSKAKFVTTIDGEKAAQLMLVVGTNGGGLEHPNWRENMKFALKIQNAIGKNYPGLMRGVNLRKERFNGHTTSGSLIIEVGSSGNTLKEAVRGAKIAAEEIAEFLKGL